MSSPKEYIGYIYLTTNLINGKVYVGQQTTNTKNYYGSGNLIKLALSKYGIHNFKKEILCYCSTVSDLNESERFYISKYNSTNKKIGYNIAIGGTDGTMLGRKHSELTKHKISQSHTGKILSDEHKKKLSESKKGKKLPKRTDEFKQKLRLANLGKKHTKESKNKMSQSHKGKRLTEKTKYKMSEIKKGEKNHFYGCTHNEKTKKLISLKNSKKVYQYSIDGELMIIWESLSKCAKDSDISLSHLHRCLKNGKVFKNRIYKYE